MTKSITKMLEEFRRYWKHYVFQYLLATFVVFIVLLVLSLKNAVIIASIGAPAFFRILNTAIGSVGDISAPNRRQ